ncbi:hypothetical protein Goari_002980, partial [Gossypium aridum]|nr:hypothetical protein [Gossypium aridum]
MGEFCRLRVKLNVQRPLRRGTFVSIGTGNKYWIPFKYEKLPTFYFGCRRLGHGLHDCTEITPAEKNRIREDPPFSLALKAELNLEAYLYSEQSSGMMKGVQDDDGLTTTEVDLDIQKEEGINEGKIENNNANILNSVRKVSWKRMKSMGVMRNNEIDSKLQKRKLAEIAQDDYGARETQEETPKRARHGGQAVKRLRFLLKQNNPQIVFLKETKVSEKHMEIIRRRCRFTNGLEVGAVGTRGEIYLAWREEVQVNLKTLSTSHIDVLIKEEGVNEEWRF